MGVHEETVHVHRLFFYLGCRKWHPGHLLAFFFPFFSTLPLTPCFLLALLFYSITVLPRGEKNWALNCKERRGEGGSENRESRDSQVVWLRCVRVCVCVCERERHDCMCVWGGKCFTDIWGCSAARGALSRRWVENLRRGADLQLNCTSVTAGLWTKLVQSEL